MMSLYSPPANRGRVYSYPISYVPTIHMMAFAWIPYVFLSLFLYVDDPSEPRRNPKKNLKKQIVRKLILMLSFSPMAGCFFVRVPSFHGPAASWGSVSVWWGLGCMYRRTGVHTYIRT
ncbi:hypothetical protein BZA77DRAFT_320909 [Pyronema omphalodes]|nr:hypothetical protein BZA77DRAFT_320909 [Pyronema omphalodes]